MSAHLTVYTMAMAAERPLRMRAAEHAYLAAHAETVSGPPVGRLLRHLDTALRRCWCRNVAARQGMETRRGGWTTHAPQLVRPGLG
jgi:hypothetical protein